MNHPKESNQESRGCISNMIKASSFNHFHQSPFNSRFTRKLSVNIGSDGHVVTNTPYIDIKNREFTSDFKRNVSFNDTGIKFTNEERVRQVQSNKKLQKLLAEEISKSKVVTTLGYAAIYRMFLFSDIVEQELLRERAEKAAAAEVKESQTKQNGKMTRNYSMNFFSLKKPDANAIRRRSTEDVSSDNSSINSSIKKSIPLSNSFNSQGSRTFDTRIDANDLHANAQKSNIAPRKESINSHAQNNEHENLLSDLQEVKRSFRGCDLVDECECHSSDECDESVEFSDFEDESDDKCAWLPWPQKDVSITSTIDGPNIDVRDAFDLIDSANEVDYNHGSSFHPSSESFSSIFNSTLVEDGGFLPWPAKETKSLSKCLTAGALTDD